MNADDRVRRKALRDAYKGDQRQAAWTALGLDRPALDDLLEHLDEQLAQGGCDGSHHFTSEWADLQGRSSGPLLDALRGAGGYCDCEVLANVDPDG